jgi:hypothetical protein
VSRTARCSCGALALTLRGEPVLNALCHCGDCRRRTGSAFGWNSYWLAADVALPGDTALTRSVPVDAPQTRHACPQCGTVVWWTSGSAVGLVGVAAGTIEPPLAEPIATYADDQRCQWLALPETWVRYP